MNKRQAKRDKRLRAATYIRMSTDAQEESPDRQRADIGRLADSENCRVVARYEDLGKTGTESENRESFQRMMADAQQGKFDVILMSEQSRLSRESVLDALLHAAALKAAGVQLITCQRGRTTSTAVGSRTGSSGGTFSPGTNGPGCR